jgi:hypothetical protein
MLSKYYKSLKRKVPTPSPFMDSTKEQMEELKKIYDDRTDCQLGEVGAKNAINIKIKNKLKNEK